MGLLTYSTALVPVPKCLCSTRDWNESYFPVLSWDWQATEKVLTPGRPTHPSWPPYLNLALQILNGHLRYPWSRRFLLAKFGICWKIPSDILKQIPRFLTKTIFVLINTKGFFDAVWEGVIILCEGQPTLIFAIRVDFGWRPFFRMSECHHIWKIISGSQKINWKIIIKASLNRLGRSHRMLWPDFLDRNAALKTAYVLFCCLLSKRWMGISFDNVVRRIWLVSAKCW